VRLSLAALAALTAAALACTPAQAAARRTLQPPTPGTQVSGAGPVPDRVVGGSPGEPTAKAAATQVYTTSDGYTIRVSLSPTYVNDTSAVQKFVDFLGSLPHGSELGRLSLTIATPAQVGILCGSSKAAACYFPSEATMVVPGEQPPATSLPLAFLIAHEYGHQIANYRSNSPWDAEEWGPKYWTSYERVCAGVARNRYFPGNEGSRYLSNPGEAWAEAYAHITYPNVRWDFNPSLEPGAGAYDAARRDVLTPWKRRATQRFDGTLSSSRDVRSFRFKITLDGSLSARVSGPSGANYDLALYLGSKRIGSTRSRGARDRLTVKRACRTSATASVKVRVIRRTGSGPFTVTAKYAG
jgi:hypothetical protein